MSEHYSVMLKETIELLNINPKGVYVDGTLGRGGHSKSILNKLTTGSMICFDKDGKLTLGYFIKGCRFTDDSVMTLAIANALMECKGDFDNLSDVAIKYMKEYGRKYPLVGYGNNFNRWNKQCICRGIPTSRKRII